MISISRQRVFKRFLGFKGLRLYHKFFMVKTQIFSVLPQKIFFDKFLKVGGLNFFFDLNPKKSHIQGGQNRSQRKEIYMFNTSIERELHSLS